MAPPERRVHHCRRHGHHHQSSQPSRRQAKRSQAKPPRRVTPPPLANGVRDVARVGLSRDGGHFDSVTLVLLVGKSRYASFTAAVPTSVEDALDEAPLFGRYLVSLAANSGNTPGSLYSALLMTCRLQRCGVTDEEVAYWAPFITSVGVGTSCCQNCRLFNCRIRGLISSGVFDERANRCSG